MRACDHPGVRAQLLAVAQNALRCLGPRAAPAARPLLAALLQLLGPEADPARRAAISETIAALAAHCGLPSAAALAGAHAGALLEAASADAASWGAGSPNYLLFRALLQACGPAALAALLPAVAEVVGPAVADHERDPQLRLGLLALLDELLEDGAKGGAFGGGHAPLALRRLLLPPLAWRAGKVAAAVRYAGATCLATFASRRLASGAQLLALAASGELLPPVLGCMEEDWFPDLRHSACYCLEQLLLACGPGLGAEQRRAVYPELLKRLDDSSDRVRLAACGALVALVAGMPGDYCDTNSGYLAAGVAIHMDDGEAEVQEAACAVMEALAGVKPGVVAAEVGRVAARFRSKHYCERVLAACAAAQARGGGQGQGRGQRPVDGGPG
jgi:dynein assembly factor 5